MTEVGIAAFGAYVPRLRLQRAAIAEANAWFAPGLRGLAKGERAMANWDEDALTMAVEAARDALPGERALDALILASTTAPFADRQNAGIVKEALDLDDAVATLDVAGSQRAGVSALIQALATARGGQRALCLAADRRAARPASEAELTNGDGAAAVVLAPGPGIARCLATFGLSADFVDHFRAGGEATDYEWEARWLRDEGYGRLVPRAVAGALARAGLAADAIDAFVFPAAGRGVAESVARACGIRAEAVRSNLGGEIGQCGVAQPLLMLAAALEGAGPGQRIVVAGFGQGCDVALFETTDAIGTFAPRRGVAGALAARRPETNYLKFLAFTRQLALERGMRAEFDQKQPLTALWRHRRTVLGLVGGRCPATGTVQFPRSDIGVDGLADSIAPMEDWPLAEREARIVTFTADSLTYTPDPPNHYGQIDFDGGGRMTAEFCDVEPDDLAVGRRMRMMFRIKAIDERRHFVRYFWKAAPVREND